MIKELESYSGMHIFRKMAKEALEKKLGRSLEITTVTAEEKPAIEAQWKAMYDQVQKQYDKDRAKQLKFNYEAIKDYSKEQLLALMDKYTIKDVNGNVDDWNAESLMAQGFLKAKIKRVGKGQFAHKGTIIAGTISNFEVTYEFGFIKGQFETSGQGKWIKEPTYRQIWNKLKAHLK